MVAREKKVKANRENYLTFNDLIFKVTMKKHRVSPKKNLKQLEIGLLKNQKRSLKINRKQLAVVANFYGYVHRGYCSGVYISMAYGDETNGYIGTDMRFYYSSGYLSCGIIFWPRGLSILSFYTALMILRARNRLPTHVVRIILCCSDEFIKRNLLKDAK